MLWDVTTMDGQKIVGDGTPYIQAQTILEKQYKTRERDRYSGPKRNWIDPTHFD